MFRRGLLRANVVPSKLCVPARREMHLFVRSAIKSGQVNKLRSLKTQTPMYARARTDSRLYCPALRFFQTRHLRP